MFPEFTADHEVIEHLKSWFEAVKLRSVEKVMAHYSPYAYLIGTMDSDGIRRGPAAIQDYFEHFLDVDGLDGEMPFDRRSFAIISAGPHRAQALGYYRFDRLRGAEQQIVPAKYSITVERITTEKPLILAHVSGLTPLRNGHSSS